MAGRRAWLMCVHNRRRRRRRRRFISSSVNGGGGGKINAGCEPTTLLVCIFCDVWEKAKAKWGRAGGRMDGNISYISTRVFRGGARIYFYFYLSRIRCEQKKSLSTHIASGLRLAEMTAFFPAHIRPSSLHTPLSILNIRDEEESGKRSCPFLVSMRERGRLSSPIKHLLLWLTASLLGG